MRLEVTLFETTKTGASKAVGDLIYDNGKIAGTTAYARRILSRPIAVPPDGRELFARDDPLLFMKTLYLVYSGSYFRAGKAVEVK